MLYCEVPPDVLNENMYAIVPIDVSVPMSVYLLIDSTSIIRH